MQGLMYSQNRLNVNRIPYFLHLSAYSTCRVGGVGEGFCTLSVPYRCVGRFASCCGSVFRAGVSCCGAVSAVCGEGCLVGVNGSCPSPRPLHDIVITNIVWCIAYTREVGRGVSYCSIIVQ